MRGLRNTKTWQEIKSSGQTWQRPILELTEEVLLDLEIGFLHRFVYKLIWKHIHIEEDLVGKAELMLKALQRGVPPNPHHKFGQP